MKALIISLILLVVASSCTNYSYQLSSSCSGTTEIKMDEARWSIELAFRDNAMSLQKDTTCQWAVVEYIHGSKRDTIYSFNRN